MQCGGESLQRGEAPGSRRRRDKSGAHLVRHRAVPAHAQLCTGHLCLGGQPQFVRLDAGTPGPLQLVVRLTSVLHRHLQCLLELRADLVARPIAFVLQQRAALFQRGHQILQLLAPALGGGQPADRLHLAQPRVIEPQYGLREGVQVPWTGGGARELAPSPGVRARHSAGLVQKPEPQVELAPPHGRFAEVAVHHLAEEFRGTRRLPLRNWVHIDLLYGKSASSCRTPTPFVIFRSQRASSFACSVVPRNSPRGRAMHPAPDLSGRQPGVVTDAPPVTCTASPGPARTI